MNSQRVNLHRRRFLLIVVTPAVEPSKALPTTRTWFTPTLGLSAQDYEQMMRNVLAIQTLPTWLKRAMYRGSVEQFGWWRVRYAIWSAQR